MRNEPNLLPIIPDCVCLVIHGELTGQDVTAVKLVTAWPDVLLNCHGRLWEIDQDAIWVECKTGKQHRLPIIPEKSLRRIDGFENKQISRSKIIERVMS